MDSKSFINPNFVEAAQIFLMLPGSLHVYLNIYILYNKWEVTTEKRFGLVCVWLSCWVWQLFRQRHTRWGILNVLTTALSLAPRAVSLEESLYIKEAGRGSCFFLFSSQQHVCCSSHVMAEHLLAFLSTADAPEASVLQKWKQICRWEHRSRSGGREGDFFNFFQFCWSYIFNQILHVTNVKQ